MAVACWYGDEFTIIDQEPLFTFNPESAWINVVPFQRLFAMQSFFLLTYVYLEQRATTSTKSKSRRAKCVNLTSICFIMADAFLYGFCDAEILYRTHKLDIMWNIIFVGLGFLLMLI